MTMQAFGRELLEEDRAARRDLVVPVGRELDDRGLLLVAGELADDALAQAADDLVLLERREADQHRDAVAEEGDEAVLAGPEGEGGRGEHVAALEPGDVEAVAQQERAGGDPRSGLGRVQRLKLRQAIVHAAPA